jgi:hypothetical protein
MQHKRIMVKVKRALLATMAVAMGTACSCNYGLRDLRHNLVQGTAAFVIGYTTSFWNAVAPEWDDVLNPNQVE